MLLRTHRYSTNKNSLSYLPRSRRFSQILTLYGVQEYTTYSIIISLILVLSITLPLSWRLRTPLDFSFRILIQSFATALAPCGSRCACILASSLSSPMSRLAKDSNASAHRDRCLPLPGVRMRLTYISSVGKFLSYQPRPDLEMFTDFPICFRHCTSS